MIPITHRALGPNVVGNPGMRPDAQATGINRNARAELDKYANDAKARVLAVVDRKGGQVGSQVNHFPEYPASTYKPA